jgi:hypothetical protein
MVMDHRALLRSITIVVCYFALSAKSKANVGSIVIELAPVPETG